MMRHETHDTCGSFPSAASFHYILTWLQWYAKFSPQSRTDSFSNYNLSNRVDHSHAFIGRRLRWRVTPCGNHVAVNSQNQHVNWIVPLHNNRTEECTGISPAAMGSPKRIQL